MNIYNLSKDQINILKGIAITLIVFHNFLHWTNSIGENEMSYDPNRIFVLFNTIKGDFTITLNALFSYFGHYGVQLFIFTSAYGLTKQFAKKENDSYLSYLVPRLSKLYGLLIFGLIIYGILFFHELTLNEFIPFAVSSLLMYNNFSFDTLFPQIAPWWYFGLAFQLYIIFPFLYRFVNRYKEKGFVLSIIISYILIYALHGILKQHNIPMFGNFIGHLPEFLLGIGLALYKKFDLNWKIILPTFALFILSNFSRYFFPLSFLTITILLLMLFYPIYSKPTAKVNKLILFIGNISMFMFLINGPLRPLTMHYMPRNNEIYIFLTSVLHFCIVIVVSYIMSLVYNKLANLTGQLKKKLIKQ